MRIGIVGAGISGLACARELSKAGHEVIVLEKSRAPGGRINTRFARDGGYIWDTGATNIAPRGKAIEQVMLHELAQDDLVLIERPIFVHDSLRVSQGSASKNNVARYTYRNGNQQLARLLAAELDVRYEVQVEEIQESDNGYLVAGEHVEALVLTPPIPQSTQLLWTLGESRPVANSRFRPCLSVLFGFNHPNPDISYHALIEPEQVHPLTWLCVESLKAPGRATEGKSAMVAQLSARFSLEHYSKSDDWVIQSTLSFVKHLYGVGFAEPEVAMVKRWKYSQPENLARFEAVNQPGSRLLLAGDGLLGGRIEDAYECGVRVAQLIEHA
jgi:renalase